MKVVLLIGLAILIVVLLGPLVGTVELGIIAALDALVIGLVLHHDRRKPTTGA